MRLAIIFTFIRLGGGSFGEGYNGGDKKKVSFNRKSGSNPRKPAISTSRIQNFKPEFILTTRAYMPKC
jgi:hypothetical protein